MNDTLMEIISNYCNYKLREADCDYNLLMQSITTCNEQWPPRPINNEENIIFEDYIFKLLKAESVLKQSNRSTQRPPANYNNSNRSTKPYIQFPLIFNISSFILGICLGCWLSRRIFNIQLTSMK